MSIKKHMQKIKSKTCIYTKNGEKCCSVNTNYKKCQIFDSNFHASVVRWLFGRGLSLQKKLLATFSTPSPRFTRNHIIYFWRINYKFNLLIHFFIWSHFIYGLSDSDCRIPVWQTDLVKLKISSKYTVTFFY